MKKVKLAEVFPVLKPKDLGMCQWFLGCRNQAVGTKSHPILGEVPICERCLKKAS